MRKKKEHKITKILEQVMRAKLVVSGRRRSELTARGQRGRKKE